MKNFKAGTVNLIREIYINSDKHPHVKIINNLLYRKPKKNTFFKIIVNSLYALNKKIKKELKGIH